jgi:hypothetical protein
MVMEVEGCQATQPLVVVGRRFVACRRFVVLSRGLLLCVAGRFDRLWG